LKDVEAAIETHEAQLQALSRQLENPPPDPQTVQRLGQEYVAGEGALEELLKEWEALSS
jgi:hypothetical protein